MIIWIIKRWCNKRLEYYKGQQEIIDVHCWLNKNLTKEQVEHLEQASKKNLRKIIALREILDMIKEKEN